MSDRPEAADVQQATTPAASVTVPLRAPARSPLIEVVLPSLIVAVIILVLPLFIPSFVSSLVAKMLIMAVGMSLNIIGYAGTPQFGHAAFSGGAVNAVAILILKVVHHHFWINFILVLVSAAVNAAILGSPHSAVFSEWRAGNATPITPLLATIAFVVDVRLAIALRPVTGVPPVAVSPSPIWGRLRDDFGQVLLLGVRGGGGVHLRHVPHRELALRLCPAWYP
jgi:hypothetical protein